MNLVAAFTEMKCLYGFCPCCGALFRLSEATLFTKAPPPRTEFEKLDAAFHRLERREERFGEREDDVRERARQRGRRAANRRLQRIAPLLGDQPLADKDVKVLFDPVDYLVFRGLSKERCEALVFVDHPADSKRRERLQSSLQHAIKAGNLDWQTLRVDDEFRVVRDPATTR